MSALRRALWQVSSICQIFDAPYLLEGYNGVLFFCSVLFAMISSGGGQAGGPFRPLLDYCTDARLVEPLIYIAAGRARVFFTPADVAKPHRADRIRKLRPRRQFRLPKISQSPQHLAAKILKAFRQLGRIREPTRRPLLDRYLSRGENSYARHIRFSSVGTRRR